MRSISSGIVALLAMGVLACGGDSTSAPEPAARLALRVQPSGAQVGTALKTQPVVEIQDAGGHVSTASNAQVTVALGSGGGTLKGTMTVSAVNGVATFSDLELGGTVGDRTLAFTSAGLTGVTSQSVALAAGTAKSLRFTTAPSPDAQTMIALTRQPVVQAADADGNAAAFAGSITAAITGGNAVVTGGASAPTNATGAATFNGLTLGALKGNVGTATLQFAAPGLNPVTASINLFCATRLVTTGTTLSGSLTSGDCTFDDGFYNHIWAITSSAPSAYTVTMDGSFRTGVFVRGPNEPNFYWGFDAPTTSNQISYGVLVPSGTSWIAATSQAAATTGSYTLRVDQRSTDVTCTTIVAASPLLTSQRLATGDCTESGFLGDFYYIGLPKGAVVNASVTNAAFAPYAAIWQTSPSTRVATSNANGTVGPTAASVTYTNSTATEQMFYLYVGSQTAGLSGAYNLSLSISYPLGVSAAGPSAITTRLISPREAMSAAIREREADPR